MSSPLCSADFPPHGAITRTATNIRSGGKTLVAGMVHFLIILAALLFIRRVAVTTTVSQAQIRRVDFAGKIGEENICPTVDDAQARAAELHSKKTA